MSDHVFAYGSLAGELIAARAADDAPRAATLAGRRRIWGVAADNERAVPGYKQYRLRSDGSLPRVFVAFLDLADDPGCAVNGVLAPVEHADLADLDRRERNYDRVDVTAAIEKPPAGRVWTYVGSPAGRARFDAGVRAERAVVCRDYVERLHAAFLALGGNEYERFLASSRLDGLPVLDLERVDLPPEGPRR